MERMGMIDKTSIHKRINRTNYILINRIYKFGKRDIQKKKYLKDGKNTLENHFTTKEGNM